jgi:hypothetical protein
MLERIKSLTFFLHQISADAADSRFVTLSQLTDSNNR